MSDISAAALEALLRLHPIVSEVHIDMSRAQFIVEPRVRARDTYIRFDDERLRGVQEMHAVGSRVLLVVRGRDARSWYWTEPRTGLLTVAVMDENGEHVLFSGPATADPPIWDDDEPVTGELIDPDQPARKPRGLIEIHWGTSEGNNGLDIDPI